MHVVRNLDRYSGAAYQALNLAVLQISTSVQPIVVNISDDLDCSEDYKNGIKIFNLPRNSNFLKISLLFYNSDIAHFHGMFFKEIVLARILGCRVLLKSTLLGEDDFHSIYLRSLGWCRMLILSNCIHVNNSLSSPIYEINKNYLSERKLIKIPNFVTVTECPISKDNIVVFVGAIVKRKRPLESIKFFEKHFLPLGYKMLVIGPEEIFESLEDKEYYQQVMSYAAKLSCCISFTGKIPQSEVRNIYKTAKVLIFLSEKEGMPNVVLEAMAENCFPITSDIGGIAQDLYSHRSSGFNIDLDEIFDVNLVDISIADRSMYNEALRRFDFRFGVNIYESTYERMMCK